MKWRLSLDKWRKSREPIPQTSPMERAQIAKARFLRQAKFDPEQASLTLGQLPMDIGHRAMMLIVAELAHRIKE